MTTSLSGFWNLFPILVKGIGDEETRKVFDHFCTSIGIGNHDFNKVTLSKTPKIYIKEVYPKLMRRIPRCHIDTKKFETNANYAFDIDRLLRFLHLEVQQDKYFDLFHSDLFISITNDYITKLGCKWFSDFRGIIKMVKDRFNECEGVFSDCEGCMKSFRDINRIKIDYDYEHLNHKVLSSRVKLTGGSDAFDRNTRYGFCDKSNINFENYSGYYLDFDNPIRPRGEMVISRVGFLENLHHKVSHLNESYSLYEKGVTAEVVYRLNDRIVTAARARVPFIEDAVERMNILLKYNFRLYKSVVWGDLHKHEPSKVLDYILNGPSISLRFGSGYIMSSIKLFGFKLLESKFDTNTSLVLDKLCDLHWADTEYYNKAIRFILSTNSSACSNVITKEKNWKRKRFCSDVSIIRRHCGYPHMYYHDDKIPISSKAKPLLALCKFEPRADFKFLKCEKPIQNKSIPSDNSLRVYQKLHKEAMENGDLNKVNRYSRRKSVCVSSDTLIRPEIISFEPKCPKSNGRKKQVLEAINTQTENIKKEIDGILFNWEDGCQRSLNEKQNRRKLGVPIMIETVENKPDPRTYVKLTKKKYIITKNRSYNLFSKGLDVEEKVVCENPYEILQNLEIDEVIQRCSYTNYFIEKVEKRLQKTHERIERTKPTIDVGGTLMNKKEHGKYLLKNTQKGINSYLRDLLKRRSCVNNYRQSVKLKGDNRSKSLWKIVSQFSKVMTKNEQREKEKEKEKEKENEKEKEKEEEREKEKEEKEKDEEKNKYQNKNKNKNKEKPSSLGEENVKAANRK